MEEVPSFEERSRDKLHDDLIRMMEQGSLNDVKIKLSDGEINANKDILMIRCEYFNTMFDTDKFLEGETNTVDMSHCSKAIMEKIIKFLFSGTIIFKGLSLIQWLGEDALKDHILRAEVSERLVDSP